MPCCKNCHKAHGKHISSTDLFKIKLETKEQLLQLLDWVKKEQLTLSKADVSKIKLHLYKEPELIFKILPLVCQQDKQLVLSWLMVKPFEGCTSSSKIFNQLMSIYQPEKIWWLGILNPLKIADKCQNCNQDRIICMEHRLHKWLGSGGNIIDVVKAAHKLKLPDVLLKRLDLIIKPQYSIHQIKLKENLIKEICSQ